LSYVIIGKFRDLYHSAASSTS